MSSKGMTKSAAKLKIPCNVRCKHISKGEATVGTTYSVEQARALGRNIAMLTEDPELEGDIILTSHFSETNPHTSVLRYTKYKKGQKGTAKK